MATLVLTRLTWGPTSVCKSAAEVGCGHPTFPPSAAGARVRLALPASRGQEALGFLGLMLRRPPPSRGFGRRVGSGYCPGRGRGVLQRWFGVGIVMVLCIRIFFCFLWIVLSLVFSCFLFLLFLRSYIQLDSVLSCSHFILIPSYHSYDALL